MKRTLFLLVMLVLSFVVAKAQDNQLVPAKGFAVDSAEGHFHPYEFTHHAVGDNDILIEIQYAGICHGDLYAVKRSEKAGCLVFSDCLSIR